MKWMFQNCEECGVVDGNWCGVGGSELMISRKVNNRQGQPGDDRRTTAESGLGALMPKVGWEGKPGGDPF
jgi:hypothetical protein